MEKDNKTMAIATIATVVLVLGGVAWHNYQPHSSWRPPRRPARRR